MFKSNNEHLIEHSTDITSTTSNNTINSSTTNTTTPFLFPALYPFTAFIQYFAERSPPIPLPQLQPPSSQNPVSNNTSESPDSMSSKSSDFLANTALTALAIAGGSLLTVLASHLLSSYLQNNDLGEECPEQLVRAQDNWRRKHADEPFPNLSFHEQMIMKDMIFPEQISASFNDVGGLVDHKESLWETVLFPLTQPHVYQQAFDMGGDSSSGSMSNLLAPPLGVLFYGPPGCGKTLMAKAIAGEAGCTFINCNIASLFNKYYGETEKFVGALFSLARKFSPSIIFIDEIDMVLGKRGGDGERGLDSRLRAQFLTLWDGLTTNFEQHVIVLAATNRPYDLDEAVSRRFGKQLMFQLPTAAERLHVLEVLLSTIPIEDNLLPYVVSRTEGYSGSDLKELCKRAAIEAFREHINKHRDFQVKKQQYQQRYNVELNDEGVIITTTTQELNTNSGTTNGGNSNASVWSGLLYGGAADKKTTSTPTAPPLTHNLSVSKNLPPPPQPPGRKPRATSQADFDQALREILPTGRASMEYLQRFQMKKKQ